MRELGRCPACRGPHFNGYGNLCGRCGHEAGRLGVMNDPVRLREFIVNHAPASASDRARYEVR